jgi:hypothetical protein
MKITDKMMLDWILSKSSVTKNHAYWLIQFAINVPREKTPKDGLRAAIRAESRSKGGKR